ncbi:protein IsiD [Gloeomargarita lithophora]
MNAQPLTEQEIQHLTPAQVSALAQRLERDDYPNAFASLQDWHLLRKIAFQRPDLVESYMHLLDLEAYDES